MEISYWQARWKKDKTGWHMQQVYPHLKTYWNRLQLDDHTTVLVPLCGKSLDMLWLKNQAHKVIGVDVSEKAAKDFFREHQLPFKKSFKGSFTIYYSGDLAIWVGDFLKLKPNYLPKIDAIYDKAALIALPEGKRKNYAGHIIKLSNVHTQILMNTFEYKQDEMSGPPFSVFQKELDKLYGSHFTIHLLHQESIFDELLKFQQRGLSSFLVEKVYHLEPVD